MWDIPLSAADISRTVLTEENWNTHLLAVDMFSTVLTQEG